jgi:hypothetical protein
MIPLTSTCPVTSTTGGTTSGGTTSGGTTTGGTTSGGTTSGGTTKGKAFGKGGSKNGAAIA